MTGARANFSLYYDAETVRTAVAEGRHRDQVGGLWDEIGTLQFEFLRSQGLQPAHYLLDIGCGCLRGGVHFIRFLEPAHYYGLDLNQCLLDAGYDRELPDQGVRDRLPRSNLLCDGQFDFGRFGMTFDYALAFSLFTHLPLNAIRMCLERLSPVVRRGGVLFATFFEVPAGRPTWVPLDRGRSGIVTYGSADPFHYRVSDMTFAAAGLPWQGKYIGPFNHPRGQVMMAFRKMAAEK